MANTYTYDQVKAELDAAEQALQDAYQACKTDGWQDAELQRAWARAESERDRLQQLLRYTPKPAQPAPVDYGRCKECGQKLTKFDAVNSDRQGYCYDCA